MRTETAVYELDGAEFVFVPGDTVTLGWESFADGLDADTQADMADGGMRALFPGLYYVSPAPWDKTKAIQQLSDELQLSTVAEAEKELGVKNNVAYPGYAQCARSSSSHRQS